MKHFALLLIAGIIMSCDVPKDLQFPESASSSIIGVYVKVNLLNAFPKKQTAVYFVKLEEKDENILGSKIIEANYIRDYVLGNYAYLLNAEPGKYAIVCSTKFERNRPNTYSEKETEYGYITFFDSNIIEKSIVNVGPGQIVYMGSYFVNSQLKSVYRNIEKNGDRAQQHYYNLLKSSMDGTFYCGALLKADKTEKTTREFLTDSQKYFKGTGWKKIIDTAIENLGKTVQPEQKPIEANEKNEKTDKKNNEKK